MIVDADVALEVACHEAVVRQAYKDSVGKWTWSVGLTSATGHNVERYIGNPQPLQYCLDVYVWALERYAEQVQEVFEDAPLTQAQFAAAVSFHWNTGAIKTASWVQHWKAGEMEAARDAFMLWRKPPEILKRREKEAALLFDGVWANQGQMVEYTKVEDGRPVWSSAKKINVDKALRKAFIATSPTLDQMPDPDAPVTPTLSPDVDRVAHNLLQLLWAWIRRLFGA